MRIGRTFDMAARQRNEALFDGPFGAAYSFYIGRRRLGRVVSRLFWASDLGHYYASLDGLAGLPAGATVIDCPCGSGIALRALRAGPRVRYVGFDVSRAMLGRASRLADELGMEQDVALAEGEASRLPLPDEAAEVFLSYFGLHCFDDPEAALREAARCLAPGGRLMGSAIVRGGRPLDGLRVRPGVGGFGAVGDEGALRGWLAAAGFEGVQVETRGVFSVFSATRPGRPRGQTAAR